MQSSIDKRWISLRSLPKDVYFGDVLFLNDHEFILASEQYDDMIRSIYKYNVHQNEWNKFIPYPHDLYIGNHKIAINRNTNTLYLSGYYNPMIIINTESKTFHTNLTQNCCIDAGYPGLINVNGTIHRIGGGANSKHLTWNDTNNSFQEIHDFKEYGEIDSPSLVYIPSKDIILLIGGIDEENENGKTMISDFWRYNLISNEWHKIGGIKFNFFRSSTVLTSNEDFVIIAGGYDENYGRMDKMHVLDIRDKDNYILRESSICCPMAGDHNIVRSGGLKDELLVIGWIKYLFNSSSFMNMQLPPIYIMQLISKWYSQETIHWIASENPTVRKRQNDHFAINLKHILSSLL